ncbi:MAG: flagellin, partial [Lachnospiraceae bacterium]
TQFNKKNLLDGTLKKNKLQIGANVGQNIAVNINNMEAASIGLEVTTNTTYTYTIGGTSVAGFELSTDARNAAKNLVYEQHNASVITSDGKYYIGGNATSKFVTLDSVKNVLASTNGLTASADMTSVARSTRTAVDNFTVANKSLSKIQTAINKVSNQRSALGALQNRLEHTISNLDTVSENTSSAESRIRDVDMAKEMVEYSKNNILSQAGQSMLAQANQSTQGVLSLLQ